MNLQGDVMKGVAAASDAVIGAAVLTGLGVWGGLYLDERLNSTPWFAVSLGLLGGGLGLARMVKKALDAEKQSSDADDSGKGAGNPPSTPDDSQDSGSDSII